MVTIVRFKTAAKSLDHSRAISVLARVTASAAMLALAACASDSTEQTAEAPPPATGEATTTADSSGFVFGGGGIPGAAPGASRFGAQAPAAAGAPDLNPVPTEVPEPRSTKEERDRALSGLVADRVNARYSDQAGRTQPVAVRPLVDTPEAARTDAVARLDAPAPERPPEAATPEPPLPESTPVSADVGPRAPNSIPRRGADEASAGGVVAANPGGFRPLADFVQASYGRATLAGTLAMTGGNLTPNDRNVLNTTARQQIDTRGTGAIRVVGHGSGGMERALAAAAELQRLGVSPSNLFVGVDNITGPTEVFFVRGK
jgi:hypothetical protein